MVGNGCTGVAHQVADDLARCEVSLADVALVETLADSVNGAYVEAFG